MSCKSPVLLVVFNRPLSTKRVFEEIRKARPPKLFVAADGPRAGIVDEAVICEQVREIVSEVDWPCEFVTLFRDQNMGCKRAVSGAIDWFFEHVEQGIILEDDCVPIESFFPYCDELLNRYALDVNVAQISGSTFVPYAAGEDSYYFTKYADIWGWATWRRAWQQANMAMKDWPEWRDNRGLEGLCGSTPAFVEYWQKLFNCTHAGAVDTWDYQWMFTCWKLGLKTIKPAKMQIYNIGFGSNATHTLYDAPDYAVEPEALMFPLHHPQASELNRATEKLIAKNRYHIDWLTEAAFLASQVPLIGRPLVKLAKIILRPQRSVCRQNILLHYFAPIL
jgi:hypothetical protein